MINQGYDFELPSCLLKRYDRIASLTGKTREHHILNALETYIDDIEDAERGAIIMERVKRGEEGIISLEQWATDNGL